MSEEKETIRCPKCGTENSTDDKFCKECGKNLSKYIYNKNEKLTKALMFPTIIEIIAYFILAAIIIFGIATTLAPSLDSCSFNTSTEGNVFQQIYDLTGNVGFLVEKVGNNLTFSFFILSSVLLGLITAFVLWSVFKFNRIERRIIETQEMINKKG